mmetsp:Transcript_16500/g.37753  ORF Transcript_16500/g.37753 Transcript_16500/m.37753 type:complete len:234 (-) Transcript_16500:500-1201(-)
MKKSSCYCRSGPGRLLDALSCFFRGVVMSEKWVEKLVSHAVAADPGPEYEVMPRISCTIFDNLTIRIAYKAYTTQNSTGFRMDMTNWVKIPLPQHIAPTFSAERICAAAPLKHLHICAISAHRSDLRRAGKEGLFKRSLSKREFLHKFSPHNLHTRHHGRPISRRCPRCPNVCKAVTRTSSTNSTTCAKTARTMGRPAIIPVLGLSPHGEFHVCHAGYRLFSPIIQVFARHLL